MKLTRRNALIGLGSLVAGSGALVGTGAFSSVEADRTVSVSSAADANAQLGINLTGDLAGTNNDTIQFALSSNGVNLDAKTRFNDVLTITNNGTNAVDVDIQDPSDKSMVNGSTSASTTTDLTFEPATNGNENGVSKDGGTVKFDVVFDLTGTTQKSNANIPGSVTIKATDST
jgi:hypothetical protein